MTKEPPASDHRDPLVGRGHAPVGDERRSEPDLVGGGRGARPIPRPPLDPAGSSSWAAPRRVRLGLGVALVVGLGGAWIGFAPRGTPASVTDPPVVTSTARADAPTTSAAPSVVPTATDAPTTDAPTTDAPTTTAAVAPVSRVVPVPGWVPRAIAATCRARPAESPVEVIVVCEPGRGVVTLRYARFDSIDSLRRAYASAPRAERGGVGAPACARGANDERAWSTVARPAVAVGRYRCTDGVAGGANARIVWTDERARVLAAATRADADLRSLYAWWTTVPGPLPASTGR